MLAHGSLPVKMGNHNVVYGALMLVQL